MSVVNRLPDDATTYEILASAKVAACESCAELMRMAGVNYTQSWDVGEPEVWSVEYDMAMSSYTGNGLF